MTDKKNPIEAEASSKWEKLAEETVDSQEDIAEEEFEKPAEGLGLISREELETQLNALELQVAEMKDQVARARAELDNGRRRAERDIENAHKFGTERLLQALLPVADSLSGGLAGVDVEDPKQKVIADGMTMTAELFDNTLQKFGMLVIDPAQGEVFNPEQHEAMSMQESAEAESNTVLQVLQKGYSLHGRILRAAMVIVVK